MDIVKQIDQHTNRLIDGLLSSSAEQRKSLTIAILGFYFQLPNFEAVLYQYIQMRIKKKQLIADIKNGNVQNYRQAIEKSIANVDVYADSYEEPKPIALFILDAFAGATSDMKFSTNLVKLFVGIIDTLDYCENFSERPAYWNKLLEEEVEFQNEVLRQVKIGSSFNSLIYQQRYAGVAFQEV
ncbi:hypothetical protein DRF65_10980 [Chryseobacterium pennae]|uniref:Uncharacterized protein n=1 Tax=Chryseobacterium pennae TaxID=2258962 RepID=A0A3D9C8M3_9FLAO|nr:hypothetical protein [Chryseobacterium pennae]REC62230.1 hypothetical protein DRF65_10980 [Chryseobacterium pennae]